MGICKLILLLAFSPCVFSSLLTAILPSIDVLPEGTYTSYLKGPVCQPSDAIRYPSTVDEIVAIVKEANERKTTVKAFGHRHSTSDVICTDGIPVDMRKFQGAVVNADTTATVGTGMYLHDFTTFLRQNGRALRTTPAYGNITVGGAVGTGAHGSTVKYNSSISAQVVGLTIVDGNGNVVTISEEEDLHAFRVHLGLLGIVINVTVKTEPLYKVLAHNYLISDDVMTNGEIINIARKTDQCTVYWFPSFNKVLIANWTIVDVNTTGEAITADHVPPTSRTFNAYTASSVEIFQSAKSYAGMNVLQAYTMQSMLTTVPDFQPIYSENGLTVQNPAVGYYDLMFAPICYEDGDIQCPWLHGPNNNLTFLDNEMSLDLDQLPAYARTVKDILAKSPAVFPFDGIVLRFSARSDSFMSVSEGHDACHFEFYMFKRKNPYVDPTLGLAAYQTMMQSLAKNFTGRSHWGKTGLYYHSSEMLTSKLNPAARAGFVAKMNQYDPNGIFLNAFGRRLKYNETKMDTDPATQHCALLDNCVCSNDSDCASGQICTTLQGYPDYPVCDFPGTKPVALNSNAYQYDTTWSLKNLVCSSNLGLSNIVKNLLGCITSIIG